MIRFLTSLAWARTLLSGPAGPGVLQKETKPDVQSLFWPHETGGLGLGGHLLMGPVSPWQGYILGPLGGTKCDEKHPGGLCVYSQLSKCYGSPTRGGSGLASEVHRLEKESPV